MSDPRHIAMFGFWACLRNALAFGMLLIVLFAAPTHAHAASDLPIATRVLAVGDNQAGRIIVDFDKPVEVQHSLLEEPWRLVLDTDRVVFGFADHEKSFTGLVGDIRYGDMDASHSRMIFEFSDPFSIRSIKSQDAGNGLPFSIIIEYRASDPQAF
ncbi:MAG: AMIN domain-containing protein, partial [Pseudomonadota bacterium]